MPRPKKGPSQGHHYLCLICNNTFFRTKYEVQRHLQSQHTGIGYQCSQCSMIFTSRNYKHACDIREDDMIFIHRITGERGDAAKAIMTKFIREVQDSKWRYVKTMDELEPINTAPINEPSRQPRPRKTRISRTASPAPSVQLEEPEDINLDEPPPKVPRLEISRLDLEPVSSGSSLISDLDVTPSVSFEESSSSSESSESSSESESESASESEIESSPKRLINVTSRVRSDRPNKKVENKNRKEKVSDNEKQSRNKKVENENRKEKVSDNEKQCRNKNVENVQNKEKCKKQSENKKVDNVKRKCNNDEKQKENKKAENENEKEDSGNEMQCEISDDNTVEIEEVNISDKISIDKVVESKNKQSETQRKTSKDRNNNDKSVQKENEKEKETEKVKQKVMGSGSKTNKQVREKECCEEKRNDRENEIHEIRNSEKEKSAQNKNERKDYRNEKQSEKQSDSRKLQKVTVTKEDNKTNSERNANLNNTKCNEKEKVSTQTKDKDRENENRNNRKETSDVINKDKQNQKENLNENIEVENDKTKEINKESGSKKLNVSENAKDQQNSGEIVSELLLDRIMSDITNTYASVQDMDQETIAAVESITEGPLVKAIDKGMDDFCLQSVTLMQKRILPEMINDAISELVPEIQAIEEETDDIFEEGLQKVFKNKANESILDVSLEKAEERRQNMERQREAEKQQQEVCENEIREDSSRKRKHDEIDAEESSEDDEEIMNLRKLQTKRVTLNIGGVRFENSRMTLQKDPNSLLAKIERKIIPHANSFFIDRDPSHFRLILYYLRNDCQLPSLTVLPRERRYLIELETECAYYRIKGLRKIVQKRLRHLTDP